MGIEQPLLLDWIEPPVAPWVAAQHSPCGQDESAEYAVSIDGLRGIAVLIVMLAHAGVPGMRSGGVGVDIFFTLSGFLITSILLKEQDRYGSISIKNFFNRLYIFSRVY